MNVKYSMTIEKARLGLQVALFESASAGYTSKRKNDTQEKTHRSCPAVGGDQRRQRTEKSIRHGHPSTLHLWWARRPLAAARAVIFAQMVDDPSAHPDLFPTEKAQKERQRLFRIIEDLVKWENTTNETVLQQARDEIWQSWRYTCAENADHPRAKELLTAVSSGFSRPFRGRWRAAAGGAAAGTGELRQRPQSGDHTKQPDLKTIRQTFRHHLCRCTGYLPIEEAIQIASASLQTQPVIGDFKRIDPAPPRIDGPDKVTGRAKYTDDITVPGLCFGAILWSPVAAGFLRSLDISATEKSPGVIRVITANDIPGINGIGRFKQDRPLLVHDTIRFVGDALAMVIADTEFNARTACALIRPVIDPVKPTLTAEEALLPNARLIHPEGNLASQIRIEKTPDDQPEVGTRFVSSCETQHIEHALLEPLCAVAEIDQNGVLHVTAPTQNIYFDRMEIQRLLGISPRDFKRVVVHQPHIGGAFGKHEDIFVAPLAALGAFLTGRPCKVRLNRSESFRCSTKRHPMHFEHSSETDRDGRIQKVEIHITADTGAYSSWAPNILRKAAVHSTGPYEFPAVSISGSSVYSNSAFSGAMRGFGAAQAMIAAELHMDQIAHAQGIDPLEFRLRYALKRGSSTATDQLINDSEGLSGCTQYRCRQIRMERIWQV